MAGTSNLTDGAAAGAETVSSSGIATPYFMLVQMNNASLLEAYATLGIQPRPAKIEERAYPDGFSLTKALAGLAFGQQDKAEHPGKVHSDSSDPIVEVERRTTGRADDAIALAKAISGRFGEQSGNGGDLGGMVAAAIAASGLPEIDFDPDTAGIGAAILGAVGSQTSSVPDFAGSAPFSGMRMDYRPETAPMGPKKFTANRHSYASTHSGPPNILAAMTAAVAEIATGRKRGAGTGRKIRTPDVDDRDE